MQRLILLLLLAVGTVGMLISLPPGYTVIEDFDSGEVNLSSFSDKDIDPDAWAVDSTNTYQDSKFSLKLYGSNWKMLDIPPYPIDESSVWQVAGYVESLGGIHGFGITDGDNVLMYSFAGEEMLNIDDWLTTYQGYYPEEKWNLYQLPVGDDWLSWHKYKPEITGLIFVNDNDSEIYDPPGVVYFDYIIDITAVLPVEPAVYISYHIGAAHRNNDDGEYYFGVKFQSKVFDPNFNRHYYRWDFGDGNTSRDMNPDHVYKIGDEHYYTVLLSVRNGAGKWGYASVQVNIPECKSSLPLTMNFVGDVMLARRYEEPGGIIPIQGVEAIFEPSLHILGEAADISVINLESPLTTSDEVHPTKGIGFRGNPKNVEGLVYAKIDVASLANNHILDYMLSGLRETQRVLDDAGILHLGAGANSYEAYLPAFINKKGINVAFIASSDRTGQYNNFQPYLNAGFNRPGFAMMTPYYVRKQITSVRDVADLVVALLHSGSEYSREPISHYDVDYIAYQWMDEPYIPEQGPTVPPLDSPKMWDRDVRHFIINSGADLVINHHPHIIQGVELYRGKLIAHSLGNYIFDSNFPETMPSMILNAEADKEGFTGFSITPVFVDNYIPREATGELALYILDYLAARSKELDTYLHIDRENFRAHVIMDTLHIDYYDIEEEEILRFAETDENLFRSEPTRFNRRSHPTMLHHLKPFANYSYSLGKELVWFGNFEDEGANHWNMDIPGVSFDSDVKLQGERSLRIIKEQGSPRTPANLTHRVRIFEKDNRFTLHGWIKTKNASNVNIEIRNYRTRTLPAFLGSTYITTPISGDMEWTYFYKEVDLSHEETRTADIFFHSDPPDSGTSYVWFDNVGLIQWDEWQPYRNNLEIDSPNEYYYIQLETDEQVEIAFLNYSERVYEQGFAPTNIDESVPTGIPLARLNSNYPNPFNPETNISFAVNRTGNVNLSIFNIKGQRITTLIDEQLEPKPLYNAIWNGKDHLNRRVASGVYFYRLMIDDVVIDTKKCLLLK